MSSSSKERESAGSPPPNKRQKQAAELETQLSFNPTGILTIKVEPNDELTGYVYNSSPAHSEAFQYDSDNTHFISPNSNLTEPNAGSGSENGTNSSLSAEVPGSVATDMTPILQNLLRTGTGTPTLHDDTIRLQNSRNNMNENIDRLSNNANNNLLPTIREIIRQALERHRKNNNNNNALFPATMAATENSSNTAETNPELIQLELQIKSIINQIPFIREQLLNISKNIASPVGPICGSYQNEVQQFQQHQIIAIEKQIQFLEDQLFTFSQPIASNNTASSLTMRQILNIQELVVQLQENIATLQKDVTTIQANIFTIQCRLVTQFKVAKPNSPLKPQISSLQGRLRTFYHKATWLMDTVFKKFKQGTDGTTDNNNSTTMTTTMLEDNNPNNLPDRFILPNSPN